MTKYMQTAVCLKEMIVALSMKRFNLDAKNMARSVQVNVRTACVYVYVMGFFNFVLRGA